MDQGVVPPGGRTTDPLTFRLIVGRGRWCILMIDPSNSGCPFDRSDAVNTCMWLKGLRYLLVSRATRASCAARRNSGCRAPCQGRHTPFGPSR